MKYNPDKHRRKSIRLKEYDYSLVGGYFITICTYQRQCLFGDVIDGVMLLNEFGQIVTNEWLKSGEIRRELELDHWVVMPNHIHGIVFIQPVDCKNADGGNDGVQGERRSPLQAVVPLMKPRSISSFIAGFKSVTTRRINILRNTHPTKANCLPVWQRNYYEHIIRNQVSLEKIRHYVRTNPLCWNVDQLHPNNPSRW